MVAYRYKEINYAKKIVANGFQSRQIANELRILSKYYKHLGCKPAQREQLVYEFCEKNISGYNKVKYFRIINSALNHAKNKDNKIIQIESIGISDGEVEYINELKIDYDLKKLLFCLLVESKLNVVKYETKYETEIKGMTFGNSNKQYKELINISHLPSNTDIHNMIYQLTLDEYIVPVNRGKIYLEFINSLPKDGDVAFTINTFDNTGLYFDYYNSDEKVIKCECCEKLVKKTNNKSKYCKECAKQQKMELDRKRMQDVRNSRK